jgi:hypothetical protein
MFNPRFTLIAFRSLAMTACLALLAGCGAESNEQPAGESPNSAVTKPLAPSSLVATPGNAQASLTWSTSQGATNYDIKRSNINGGPYTQIASTSSPAHTDATVSNGATYYYVVTASNSNGESAMSPQVAVTPTPIVTMPAAPTALSATPGNAQVSLSWASVGNAASYIVKRATSSGGPYSLVGTPSGTSHVDGSLTNGVTYFYVVSAVNSAGESANSSQASATPVPPPPAPSTIVVTPGTAVVSYGGTIQFMGAITGGAPPAAIVWSMQESGNVGSVASDGRYTAPSAAGTYHVVARSSTNASLTTTATVTVTAPQGTPPTLVQGVWKDITPPVPGFTSTYGIANMEVSPVDPNVIYVSIDTLGMWKTTDRGSNWRRLGVPGTYNASTRRTTYLDSPIRVEVDPGNANHVIATQGVRGATLGFWESFDGGENWEMPQGFADAARNATVDITAMVVNPANFRHILLGSHSAWGSTNRPAGIMETRDGGATWVLHEAMPSWPTGSLGISFLYDPASGQGNADTWLVSTDGNGFWRTTNAGASWTKVSAANTPHGSAQTYYAKDGTLYSGGTPYPVRSRDNGATWEQLNTGLPFFYYYTVYGDGTTLYTQLSFTGDNAGQGLQPYMAAPEATGGPWLPYLGGTQRFINGPAVMAYDAANEIMYSANWRGGLWALKVIKP